MGKQETPLPFLFNIYSSPFNDRQENAHRPHGGTPAGFTNYLVDVRVEGGNAITIEIDNDEGVDIDDCAALSRHLESKLDRDTEDFELTVTSAGLTSPFK